MTTAAGQPAAAPREHSRWRTGGVVARRPHWVALVASPRTIRSCTALQRRTPPLPLEAPSKRWGRLVAGARLVRATWGGSRMAC